MSAKAIQTDWHDRICWSGLVGENVGEIEFRGLKHVVVFVCSAISVYLPCNCVFLGASFMYSIVREAHPELPPGVGLDHDVPAGRGEHLGAPCSIYW